MPSGPAKAAVLTALIHRRVANLVVVVVTVLWAVSFLVDIFREDYHPPSSIQSAFLAVIGLAFGAGLIKGGGAG